MTLTFKYISPGTTRSLTSIAEISLSPTSDDPVQPQPLLADRFTADD